MAKIALGTWAWGAGAFGGGMVFGSKTDVETLKPVFDVAMMAGLSLWDTATAYVPHNISGVMAVNKPAMSEEPVWVKAAKNR